MRNVLITILLAGIACTAVAAPRRSSRRPLAKPNVLLITIDTVRSDHVGAYGASIVKTPEIDSLARDGVVFENAYSQVPLTIASHASILTGTYPFNNGVQDFTGQPLAANFQSVAMAFKRNGYSTAAVVSSFVLDRSWGLARGFDSYFDAFAPDKFSNNNIALVDRRAQQSVDQALTWLRQRPAGKPFFLWLHLYDPHSPYDPPGEFAQQYKNDLYSGEIAYVDAQLGRLFAQLKRSGGYKGTAILLLSDHGESLGEHQEREHGFFIYSSTTHVPFIVKEAGVVALGKHIQDPIQAMDAAPTLLQLANIHDSALERQFQSKGLLPLINGGGETGLAYSETYYPFSSFGWNPLRSVRNERYQYIDAPQPELYDLTNDPEEKNNIVARQSAVASVLKTQIEVLSRRFAASVGKPSGGSVSAETAEKLRSLGYVAYRSPVSEEALKRGLADPKTKIWEFNAILRSGDLLQAGNFQEGEALLAQVREKDPEMYLVPFLLGESALRRQDWAKAATELKSCLALNPGFDQAMTALARALLSQNDVEGAHQWVKKAIDLNPQNYRAWYQMGWVESRTDPQAAIAAFERAVAIQPNFAQGERDLGVLQIHQNDFANAATHLERALKLGLEKAQLLNFLGIAYSQTGRQEKALLFYRRAISLEPGFAQAHLNLAYALQKKGQDPAALAEYKKACGLDGNFCRFVPK